MKLIADSGSTKTKWVFLSSSEKTFFLTKGINPYYQSKENILKILDKLSKIKNEVNEIYFYGAGCATIEKIKFIRETLQEYFPNAKAEVHSDLLGAARAVAKKNESLVAILGTGMNTCYYDGSKIIENVPPLGYMLGDEGSGAHIGKIVITDYLRGIMPLELRNIFEQEYNINKDIILENVYKKEFPNRYLAQFSKFISLTKDNEYSKKLIYSVFTEFYNRNLILYSKNNIKKISFIGSIAYFFKDILSEVLNKYDIRISKIIIEPIDGLIEFHSKI